MCHNARIPQGSWITRCFGLYSNRSPVFQGECQVHLCDISDADREVQKFNTSRRQYYFLGLICRAGSESKGGGLSSFLTAHQHIKGHSVP